MTEAAKPTARSEGLVIERLGDETLVYDLERDEAHNLTPVATAVFECCNGATSVASLALSASERPGREVSVELVGQAVQELAAKSLLAAGPLPVVTVSRRDVVRRAALAGVGVAGAATMIQSIVAPTPAHAQTGAPTCGGECTDASQCPSGCQCTAAPGTCFGDPSCGGASCFGTCPSGCTCQQNSGSCVN